jgi:hypothetical protein
LFRRLHLRCSRKLTRLASLMKDIFEETGLKIDSVPVIKGFHPPNITTVKFLTDYTTDMLSH